MSGFEAWALPDGQLSELPTRQLVQGTGIRRLVMAPPRLEQIAQDVRDAGESLRRRSVVSIATTLGGIGSRFGDPHDMLRMEALSALPETSGLSPEMARHVLDGMCRDWTTEVLLELLGREFGEPEALDGPPHSEAIPRLTTHIGSGTVPGVTATSLIRSLLVKSPALVKPGLGDVVLPVLWARAVQATDPELGNALAVVYWEGGDVALTSAAFERAEQIVVYGGDETVSDVRSRLRLDQRLVAYPHRVGVCGLGREALRSGDVRRHAKAAALAVATFDQRGCVSPHVIYVEEGGDSTAAEFADLLAQELSRLERELPSGVRSTEEAIGFQHLKGTMELHAAAHDGVTVFTQVGEPWTVVLEEDPGFRPSCLGRFIWVKPIADLDALDRILEPVAGHLQTVALAVDDARREKLSPTFAALGASRITTLEEAPWPRAWWRHDGSGPLRILLGWKD